MGRNRDQYDNSYKIASTGLDGKQYFVPTSWYPWGLHFRKSMFADLGLNADNVTNWDECLKMLDGMKKGLVGFAAGDKGGWEAMGTFDILNARINGYQFHVDLTGWPREVDRCEGHRSIQVMRAVDPLHESKCSRSRVGWRHARSSTTKEGRINAYGFMVLR
jgi:hypothetical protein